MVALELDFELLTIPSEKTQDSSALLDATERQRLKQLEINCRWLVAITDRIHDALCPGQYGTWQERAKQAAEAAERCCIQDASMNVSELIELLKTYPRNLPVAYECFSEHKLLEAGEIEIEELCHPREDGWVANKRPDKPTMKYLVLPGN